MTSQLAVNQSYEQRQNVAISDMNGRAKFASTIYYMKQYNDTTLIDGVEQSSRLKENYGTYSVSYVPSTVDAQGTPIRGQNIDTRG